MTWELADQPKDRHKNQSTASRQTLSKSRPQNTPDVVIGYPLDYECLVKVENFLIDHSDADCIV